LLAAAITFGVGAAVPGYRDLWFLALAFAIAALPGSLIFRGDRGWPRWVLAGMTASVIVIALAAALVDAGIAPQFVGVLLTPMLLPVLLVCVFGSQFVAAYRMKR